jgi:hypothetical protein
MEPQLVYHSNKFKCVKAASLERQVKIEQSHSDIIKVDLLVHG